MDIPDGKIVDYISVVIEVKRREKRIGIGNSAKTYDGEY
jgi:hypothetical protein